MAGIERETAAYQEVAAEGEYVLVKRKGVLAMIEPAKAR
jgi:hypothetical protein